MRLKVFIKLAGNSDKMFEHFCLKIAESAILYKSCRHFCLTFQLNIFHSAFIVRVRQIDVEFLREKIEPQQGGISNFFRQTFGDSLIRQTVRSTARL